MPVYTRDVQPSSQGSDRVENRVSPLDGPTPRPKEMLAAWFTSRNSWLKLTLTFVAMTSAFYLFTIQIVTFLLCTVTYLDSL